MCTKGSLRQFRWALSPPGLLFFLPSNLAYKPLIPILCNIKYILKLYTVYAIYFVGPGFYFREFRESGAICEFNSTQKYLPPIRPDAWMWLVYAILVVQYTVHVQGRIATFAFWKWVIALLLDREFNHSRKCLEVPIREKLDSQNILHNLYSK